MKPKPGQYDHIQDVVDSLTLYINEGRHPGNFLMAVLENNLRESFSRADSHNAAHMLDIVRYLYNYCPSACWGSKENVQAWVDFKRQQRRMEQLAKRAEPDADMNRMEHDDRGDN